MNAKVIKLLNEQVNKEFYSAYIYLGISKYFSLRGLDGFAAWYRVQAKEEQEHAMKIYNYLLDHDEDPELPEIGAVSSDYADALAAVEAADKHEHYITGEIGKIYAEALKAKDYATVLFLNWFIEEQEEEEQNSGEMI